MCHCCGAEGHLSLDCPKQFTIDQKDWFVKKAINAHQQEEGGTQTTNDTNNDDTSNNDTQNDSGSVQWNNPISTQSTQT